MSNDSTMIDVAFAAGRLAGQLAIAPPDTRAVAARRRLSAIWEAFRRDAGSGAVGREHSGPTGLLDTEDPRRDAVLLWLADHAQFDLAEAAAQAARMVGASSRFSADQQELLTAAGDLLPLAPIENVAEVAAWLASYLARLRCDERFAESSGEHVSMHFPVGRWDTYRPPQPAACWAAGLALQAHHFPVQIPPGTIDRLQFRLDVEHEERVLGLVDGWARELRRSETGLLSAHIQLRNGRAALAGLSKNARGRAAWALFVAFGNLSRVQLTRALGLSRGGGSLVARQLQGAGLVRHEGDRLVMRLLART